MLKSLPKILPTQYGFSLLEAVVATGVLAIASMGALTLSNQQIGMVKEINTKSQEIDLLYNIEKVLKNSDFCNATFVIPGVGLGDTFTTIRDPQNEILYQTTGTYFNDRIRIDSMAINNVNVTPGSGDNGTAEVVLTISRMNSSKNYEQVTRRVMVNLTADPGTPPPITGCFDTNDYLVEASNSTLCEQAGGVYDSIGDTCDMSGTCDFSTPANTNQVSTNCFVNTFLPVEAPTRFLSQIDPGTLNGHLTSNADVAVGVLQANRVFTSGLLSSNQMITFSGNFIVNGQPVATQDQIFSALDDAQQEAIINSIVTDIVNNNGVNNLRNHFRGSISVGGSACASGNFKNSFTINPVTGVISATCGSL